MSNSVNSINKLEMATERNNEICDQTTQTDKFFISQNEHNILKADIRILKSKLFETEDNYNDLLSRYLNLKKVVNLNYVAHIWNETEETESAPCGNCPILEKEIEEQNFFFKNASQMNEKLEFKVKELEYEINELKRSSLLDKEFYSLSGQKYVQLNKVLIHKLEEEMDQKGKLLQECNKHRNRPDELLNLKERVLEQILNIKYVYLSYIDMTQNKCKRMIKELEDMKCLTNANSVPSLFEVEEHLLMWRQTLETVNKKLVIMMEFYDKVTQNFTPLPPAKIPVLNLFPEPPNMIFRHFKSFYLITKSLEQDLDRHKANYYKELIMRFPGVYTDDMNQSPIPVDPGSEDLDINIPLPHVNWEEITGNKRQNTQSTESTVHVEAAAVELNTCVQTENVGKKETPETIVAKQENMSISRSSATFDDEFPPLK